MTTRAAGSSQRGVKRHAATEQALRQAWERLRTGAPTHPKLADGNNELSIAAVCLEAGCSRNALYDGHRELLDEIRAAIKCARRAPVQNGHYQRRSRTEAELARCRDERQRLISENAALLLRAVTAEEALARLKRQPLRPFKMTDDTPEAS